MGMYGFSITGTYSVSKTYGFSIDLKYQLKVTVVDANGDPLTGIDVSVYDINDELLATIPVQSNGTALFSIIENGDYYITTSETDRKQSFTYAGSDLTETYKILGVTFKYRAKVKKGLIESGYSNTFEISM